MIERTRTILSFVMLVFCLSDQGVAQRGLPNLPDPRLTPGATLNVKREDVCRSEFASPAAKIPVGVKQQTFDRYGLSPGAVGYNVDHLIPVSLGGSNSLKNLWPQSLSGEWNYYMKNRLERAIYKMVCRQDLALERAQQEIATDWVAAYKKYISNQR